MALPKQYSHVSFTAHCSESERCFSITAMGEHFWWKWKLITTTAPPKADQRKGVVVCLQEAQELPWGQEFMQDDGPSVFGGSVWAPWCSDYLWP